MADADDPILLDNCAISACVSAEGWKALVARYKLETVETVAIEEATGYQHRQTFDRDEFRSQVLIHKVSEQDRLSKGIEHADLGVLDNGERDLWIHALGRTDGWILCGPDIASIRFGVRAGHGDRLISLESLFDAIGFKPRKRLPEHQTAKWLKTKVDEFSLELQFEKIQKSSK